MRYCEHCGQAVNPGARFCTNCGAGFVAAPDLSEEPEIVISAPIAPEREAPAAELPVVATPAYSIPAEERPVEHNHEIPEDAQLAKEKACLDSFCNFLNWERKMWRIGGILQLVGAFLLLVIGIAASDVESIVNALIYLPCGIVSLCLVNQPLRYMKTIYSDARPTVKRCSRVGLIVLSFFFNELAMIFIIINFVRTKSNAPLLESIIARQESYRGSHL